MRTKRSNTEIFNLAFLDVITCGFGAILLLILITKPVPLETDTTAKNPELKSAIQQVLDELSQMRAMLTGMEISDASEAHDQSATTETANELTHAIATINNNLQNLIRDNQGLEIIKQSLQRATIKVNSNPLQRDPEVGGIPTDSEYVIFIVDTSGSMDLIWGRVIDVMNQVLDIHPKVKGFQIMNDNGYYLFDSTKRKWLPDTSRSRGNVKKALAQWASFSNSSPVEGLEVALRTYANRSNGISIYILGDDFTGSSYDSVIRTLRQLNINKTTGKPIVRVHSIGFISEYGSERFATLMRIVAERNRGAFIGLPH